VAQRVSVIVDTTFLGAAATVAINVTAMADMYPVDINGYVPDYEAGTGAVPLQPSVVAWLAVGGGGHLIGSAKLPPDSSAAPAFDTNMLSARPRQSYAAPPATHQMYLEIVFAADDDGVNRAYFNGISAAHVMDAPVPVLYGMTAGHWPRDAFEPQRPGFADSINHTHAAEYFVPYGAVVDVLINNTDGGEHPIHFHGHAFWILSTSAFPDAGELYEADPVHRDVVSVPANGWALLRFTADNPGVWAVHCHIDWHMAAGLMLTMIEGGDHLTRGHSVIVPPQQLAASCAAGEHGGDSAKPIHHSSGPHRRVV